MGGSDLSFVGLLVHELLYRFFFFETIWANVFLVLIFVVYALLLKSRGSFFLEKTLRSGFFLLGVAAWRKRWTSYQARALYHPRRQVRRQANSAVRHRV
jgi:hypothetical protein